MTRTMTASQMNQRLASGTAWYERDAEGNAKDDWRMPIWTREGAWLWDTTTQVYELLF